MSACCHDAIKCCEGHLRHCNLDKCLQCECLPCHHCVRECKLDDCCHCVQHACRDCKVDAVCDCIKHCDLNICKDIFNAFSAVGNCVCEVVDCVGKCIKC
jgi:hypothetical protein